MKEHDRSAPAESNNNGIPVLLGLVGLAICFGLVAIALNAVLSLI